MAKRALGHDDEATFDNEAFPQQLYVVRDGTQDASGSVFFHGESDVRELDANDGDLVAIYTRADIRVMRNVRELEPRDVRALRTPTAVRPRRR